MSSFSRWVLRHKLAVVAFWIVVAIAGFASVQSATNSLSTSFTVPGGEGFETSAAIVRRFGTGGDSSPIVPVLTLPAGVTVDTPGIKARIAGAFAHVAAAIPGARVASYGSTGDRVFVSADGRTTYGLIYPPAAAGASFGSSDVGRVRRLLAGTTVAGARFHVSGIDALDVGSSSGKSAGNGALVETLLAGAGALIVLAIVFGSFLAVVPVLMALVAIPTTFLLVWGLASVTDVSFIIEFLIALIGLGVAIDYSLLIVMRWREERSRGLGNEAAVLRAMETSGRAVIFSGCTVAIGLIAMEVLPLSFLRSVGLGGTLIPLVTVLVAWTLLPVVLATAGPRLDWPRRRANRSAESRPGRLWLIWAGVVTRHPAICAAAGLLILGVLLGTARTVTLGDAAADSLAKTGDAHAGLVALERSGIGAGALTPFELLVRQTSPANVARRIGSVPGVRGAVAPTGAAWQRGRDAVVDVFPIADASSPSGGTVLSAVRTAAHWLPGRVRVGGPAASNVDFVNAIYGSFPLMIVLVMLFTFVTLVRAFRSILLALKAVLLNLASVAAAWGVLVLIWQDGFGSRALWGIPATGAIPAWVPLMVFAFLFGLSMDYEVFLLSRVREEYDTTGSTRAAVSMGIGRIGRLITGAALILFLSFASMSTAPMIETKIIGTGLAAGILLDATVIRMLLVPALVVLFGRWNWWLPAPIAQVLRVPAAVGAAEQHGVAVAAE